jgi:hypothetical protein
LRPSGSILSLSQPSRNRRNKPSSIKETKEIGCDRKWWNTVADTFEGVFDCMKGINAK